MRTPEGYVKADIKKWLKEEGVYFFMPVQGGMGKRTLDFIVCWHGIFVGIEAKRPGKGPTKLQGEIIEEIQWSGGVAFCTDSLEHCKEYLASYNGN